MSEEIVDFIFAKREGNIWTEVLKVKGEDGVIRTVTNVREIK